MTLKILSLFSLPREAKAYSKKGQSISFAMVQVSLERVSVVRLGQL